MIDLEPGTPLTLRWRKWDGSPHWIERCRYLGADAYGDWVGQAAGTVSTRPGRRYTSSVDSAALLPFHRAVGDWMANFHAPGHHDRLEVYIDLAHDIAWNAERLELTAIDMDLDVVRAADQRGTWIDDVDEFAEHRARFDYPPAVVVAVESAAERLRATVAAHDGPFGGAAERWLAELGRLRPARTPDA